MTENDDLYDSLTLLIRTIQFNLNRQCKIFSNLSSCLRNLHLFDMTGFVLLPNVSLMHIYLRIRYKGIIIRLIFALSNGLKNGVYIREAK